MPRTPMLWLCNWSERYLATRPRERAPRLIPAVEIPGMETKLAQQGSGGMSPLANFAIHHKRTPAERIEMVAQRVDRHIPRSIDGSTFVLFRSADVDQ